MRRWIFGMMAVVAVAVAGTPPVWAATVPGTPVEIKAMDDLVATGDYQAKKGVGRILAYTLMFGGLTVAASGFHASGAVGFGTGTVSAFVPGIAGSAADNAPGATFLLAHGVLDDVGEQVFHLLLDPMFLLTFMVGIALVSTVRVYRARRMVFA